MSAGPVGPGEGLRTGSLRRRVTVAVWLLLAAMVVVLAVATGVALSARLDGQLRQRLTDRAQIATVLVGQISDSELVDRLEGDGVSVSLTTTEGQQLTKGPLASTATGGSSVPPAPPGPAGGPKAPAPVVDGDVYRLSTTLAGGDRLVLIASAADVRRTIVQVEITLAVGGVLVLLVAAVALGPLVGRALRPLQQMTETARSITAGDRGRRLRPTRPETELGQTAAAFDDMLDAVEGAETQARRAEDRLRVFLSDAAHELRTPLAGARAATEQVLRTDLPRAEREQRLASAVRENERAARLVDDMLTMARIDQGVELRPVPADLAELASRAVQSRRLTAPELRFALDLRPVPVQVDPDRIVQVVGNLLDNAVRYAGPQARIAVSVDRDGPVAALDVHDDGPGIPAADAERVFERLVRLDSSRTRRDGGFGLGLSIARGLARAHGGDLVCLPSTSGARFRLSLPAETAASSAERPNSDAVLPRLDSNQQPSG